MTRIRLVPVCLALSVGLSACVSSGGPAGEVSVRRFDPEILQEMPSIKQFGAFRPVAPTRSNRQIAEDFLDLGFQMESGRRIERLSRFEGPITIAVVPGAPASLSTDLDRLLARLRREARIDIRRIAHGEGSASITIEAVPRTQMQRVVPQAACFVVPRVSSWAEFRSARTSGTLDWTTLIRRDRVTVVIPGDVSPQEVRDCLHEEVGQALGPLNDLYRLHDSIFNDDNFQSVLTGFDMLILRAYYSDEIRSGMTRDEVAAILPGLLDRLNPGGAQGGADRVQAQASPRAWIDAIETAVGPGTGGARRLDAAERAVRLAHEVQLSDAHLALSYFTLGRLALTRDNAAALTAFQVAGRLYDRIAPGGIQSAHVDMQLAALALSAGNAAEALRLVDRATPGATAAQNAALLSTLLMIRAEALEALGRTNEARQARLDSLGWGRYGFGTTTALGARLTEVARLSP